MHASAALHSRSAAMTAFYVAWRKPLALAALILLAVAACGRQSGSSRAETATAVGTVGEAPGSTSGTTMIRGSVASMAASELTVRTDSGTVSVQLEPSTQVYDRKP